MRGNTAEPTPSASRGGSQAPSPRLGAMQSFSFTQSFTPEDLNLGAAATRVHGDVPGFDDEKPVQFSDPMRVAPLTAAPLSFGYGSLLRDGAGEADIDEDGAFHIAEEIDSSGKTLRGRYIVRVGWDDVRGWLGEGGTLIGSSRCPSFRTREGRLKAAHNLVRFGINCLAVCGGDGSLTGADMLRAEWPSLIKELHSNGDINDDELENYRHLNIVGLVGSIDNDMAMTDLTIGAVTALHRICESIDSIGSTASSHSRAFVIEVMGRHCGWLALMAGVATGADFIFIPEHPPAKQDWETEMCDVLKQHRRVGKRKTIVIVAEGALDVDLKPIKPEHVKNVLSERLGLDTRVTTLGHTQRGGVPAAFDRVLVSLSSATWLTPAHAPGRQGRRHAPRGDAGHAVVHDRHLGEQDHQDPAARGCRADQEGRGRDRGDGL